MLKDLCSHGERSIAWFGFCTEVVWQSVTSGTLVNCGGVATGLSMQLHGGSCSGKRKKDAQMFSWCCPSCPYPSF